MARDRQRAKQRQAARRQARLADGAPTRGGEAPGSRPEQADGATDPDVELATGAPAETIGRSDAVLRPRDPSADRIPEREELDDEEAAALDREAAREPELVGPDPARPTREGMPRDAAGTESGSIWSRLRTFLAGCLDELRRVRWPNRSQLFSLTGVVLGFCLLAGGYLGLLDFIFYRLVRAIL